MWGEEKTTRTETLSYLVDRHDVLLGCVGIRRDGIHAAGLRLKSGGHVGRATCDGIGTVAAAQRSRGLWEPTLALGARLVSTRAITVRLLIFIVSKGSGEIDSPVFNVLIEANGANSLLIAASAILADETADFRILIVLDARPAGHGGHKMPLGDKLTSEATQMLDDGSSRRARVKTMSNGIPGHLAAMASTFILDVEKKLLRHAGTWRYPYEHIDCGKPKAEVGFQIQ